MPRFTNVKKSAALDPCAISKLLKFRESVLLFHLIYSKLNKIPFRAYGSGKEDSPMCDVPGFESCKMKLLRHVSFVDCPVSISHMPIYLVCNLVAFWS